MSRGALSTCIAASLSACAVVKPVLQIPTLWVKPLTTPVGSPACSSYADVLMDDPDRPLAEAAPIPTATPTPRAAAPNSDLPPAIQDLVARAPEAGEPMTAAQPKPIDFNILVLSGGAQWGAYGAGFLNGLYVEPAERTPDHRAHLIRPENGRDIPLDEIDVITGISTGSLMAPYVWRAISLARSSREALKRGQTTEASDDDAAAAQALIELEAQYRQTDKDLLTAKNTLLYTLYSNGVADPKGRLEAKIQSALREGYPYFQTDVGRRLSTWIDVGAVNLRDGKFYSFHLNSLVPSETHSLQGASEAVFYRCGTEILLASAAIPLAFPPRYLDGEPYMDGGVRYLAYMETYLNGLRALKRRGYNIRNINVRIIVNGNQSVNDPGADVDAALACDRDRAPHAGPPSRCPAVSETLLGDTALGTGKGIVLRVTQDLMEHQIKLDSMFRLHADWVKAETEISPGPVNPDGFRFTYVSNQKLADWVSADGRQRKCEKHPIDGQQPRFDQQFESCLIDIGHRDGAAGRWLSVPLE